MKANEVPENMYIPEKIYLPYKDGKVIGLVKETGVPYKSGVDGNIEYTRTDAFIEKAIGWIDYNNRNGGSNFDGWEKDFKKYMKELSIEEKAKAYDEVLKVLHKYDGANIMFSQSLKEEMFPELKESEDERIREEMIDYFKSLLVQSDKEEFKDLINNKFKRYIAWLEKQGKEETDEWKEGNIIRRGGILALVIKGRRVMKSNGEIFTVQYPDEWVKAVPNEIEHFLNELEKQGEQKPTEDRYAEGYLNGINDILKSAAWSEEDIRMLSAAMELITICPNLMASRCVSKSSVISWLKSLKDRVQPQPKQE